MAGGRPTKYKPEFAKQLLDYFDIESGVDVEAENSKGQMQSVRHAADLPTLAGFCCKIGVVRETLWAWSIETNEDGSLAKPEFSNAIKMAKEHQERILAENALKGAYNPAFSIFTAKNVLGWRDKQEIEHSGPGGGPITISAVDMSDDQLAVIAASGPQIGKTLKKLPQNAKREIE